MSLYEPPHSGDIVSIINTALFCQGPDERHIIGVLIGQPSLIRKPIS